MEDLHIVGVEDGSLVLVDEDGIRHRLAIDETLHARIRQSLPDPGTGRKLSPREIQAQIRAGMSAHDVAQVTGASLEYIERFEGPVLAEREFVIESALAVPVHTAADPLASATTFGDAILERLAILGAVGERWMSWKEPTGWIVKLSFLLGAVEHDARWQFDPKRQTLSPVNAEAVGLSQQDAEPEPPVPHLRAVPPVTSAVEAVVELADRFDSGQFAVDPSALADSGPVLSSVGRGQRTTTSQHQTADLLDALRRRRGQRESAGPEDDAGPAMSGSVRLVELEIETEFHPSADAGRATGPIGKRKGRPTLPSWDEIVFGARGDDDPA